MIDFKKGDRVTYSGYAIQNNIPSRKWKGSSKLGTIVGYGGLTKSGCVRVKWDYQTPKSDPHSYHPKFIIKIDT